MTKEEVQRLLLENVDGINSAISNYLAVFAIIITVLSLLQYFKGKQLDKKIEEVVKNKFLSESSLIVDEMKDRVKILIGSENKKLKKDYQKEEYLRNLIFYELNNILASELNNGSNISDVFGKHGERLHVVIQLTSGDDEKMIKAIKKFSTGTYNKITRLDSFKNYINFIKKSSDTSTKVLKILEKTDF